MNERRRDRLSSFLKEILPIFFVQEVSLPKGSFISVLYIEIGESGSKANVFVSVFPDSLREMVAKELKISENKAAHFVRAHLKSKYSPSIHFFIPA